MTFSILLMYTQSFSSLKPRSSANTVARARRSDALRSGCHRSRTSATRGSRQSSKTSTQCEKLSSKKMQRPSSHPRTRSPTRIWHVPHSGTARARWQRSRMLVGPQCGAMLEPGYTTEKNAFPKTQPCAKAAMRTSAAKVCGHSARTRSCTTPWFTRCSTFHDPWLHGFPLQSVSFSPR